MAEDTLSELAPPVEFRRMLSWQLSTPSTVPVKKKRKKKARGETTALVDCGDSDSEEPGDEEYNYTVVVVNSDGEEEVYYSAPESPVFSDDDNPTDAPLKIIEATPTEQRSRKKSKSKKQKKKVRYMMRKAVTEFLGPLCDLASEAGDTVDVGVVDVASRAQVPKLTELCLRRMRKDDADMPEQLPYLLRVLLWSDHSHHSVVSTLLHWMERQLALPFNIPHVIAESFINLHFKKYWKLPIELACPANFTEPLLPESANSLHVPLFLLEYDNHDLYFMIKKWMMGPFLHFINFFFPLFGYEGHSAKVINSLTPAQLATIHYVNSFLQSRYKNLCELLSGMALLWPGYVYWARGQVKQAVAAFQHAISQLECPEDPVTLGNHRAAVLNEVGRMLSQFGERELACRFFRESEKLTTSLSSEQRMAQFLADQDMILPSVMAMEAAVYDCGLLTHSVARNAARLWRSVVQALSSLPDSTPSYWPLYLAAAESKLLVHSGEVTGVNPNEPKAQDALLVKAELTNKQFLEECRELLLTLVDREPLLQYHLSLVHAMLGHGESSKKSWSRFMERFIHFEWPHWTTEENSKFHMFNTLTPAQWCPWKPLVDLLTSSSLKQTSVLRLRWRTRLLHPHYPYYYSDRTMSRLADHCSQTVGIRMTEDGYITADWHMDLPPMRSVLLDPFSGELCFPRDGSKTHYYVRPPVVKFDSLITRHRPPDFSSLPWPVRVFESDTCVVELTVVSTRADISLREGQFANHSAWLNYYGSDGTRKKVDLRKMIRRKLRETIWNELKGSPLRDKEPLLDKLLETGRFVGLSELKEKKKLHPRFISWTSKESKQTYKILNNNYDSFVLSLESLVILGEATVMLGICLDTTRSSDRMCSALVFVNCMDSESFCNVKVHCVTDPKRHWFKMVSPSAQLYTTHFRHVRYATAIMVADHTEVLMVFDLTGELVVKKMLKPSIRESFSLFDLQPYLCPFFSIGPRLFGWTGSRQWVVFSCDVNYKHILTTPGFPTINALVPVPGLLFVHTNDGIQVLNPRTLTPVVIEGLNMPESQSGVESIYQFSVLDSLFSVLNVWDVGQVFQQPDSPKDGPDSVPVPMGEVMLWSKYSETEAESESEESATSWEDGGYGSCHVALSVNNRVVVLDVRDEHVKCVLDVVLPGKPTELHPMGPSGYIVNTTNFVDHFREELYWITVGGQLKGVLPCLGAGPRSFLSVTLSGRGGKCVDVEEAADRQGLYLYFNDGQGAIACMQLGE